MDEKTLLGGQNDTESADKDGQPTEEQVENEAKSQEGAHTEKEQETEAEENQQKEEGSKKDADDKVGAPEVYEKFTFKNQSEEADYDQELHDTFAKVAKEDNLSQAQAQKYVSMFEKTLGEMQEKSVEAFYDARKKVLDELRNDKELGGTKFNTTVENANAALRLFDQSNVLADKLKEQGFVTDGDLIPLLARVRDAISDDTLEDLGKGSGSKDNTPDHDKIGWSYKD